MGKKGKRVLLTTVGNSEFLLSTSIEEFKANVVYFLFSDTSALKIVEKTINELRAKRIEYHFEYFETLYDPNGRYSSKKVAANINEIIERCCEILLNLDSDDRINIYCHTGSDTLLNYGFAKAWEKVHGEENERSID